MSRFRARYVAWSLLLALLLGGLWIVQYLWMPLGFDGGTRDFDIEHGATLRTISHKLHKDGILADTLRFELLARALGKAGALKAGSYQIEPRWSALQLLEAISGSAYRLDKFALVEGWSFRQVRAALNAHEALRHETLSMSDQEILAALKLQESHPEGLFFPDTYYFAKGASDLAVLGRAARRMQWLLSQRWPERTDGLPLEQPYELLILASIVEKETGRDADRGLVAAVFVNRLRKGMRLQADPTVIYGLGPAFDGNLRRRDLESDTPYNTYTRTGLPPTPIAMPGLASIAAAANPQRTGALYFVARGDGSSEFSETLADHNRAVTKYQRQQATRK